MTRASAAQKAIGRIIICSTCSGVAICIAQTPNRGAATAPIRLTVPAQPTPVARMVVG